MKFRPLVASFFSSALLLSFALGVLCVSGCGGDSPTAPSNDELSDYVANQTETFDSGADLQGGDTAE